jgi:hypothetical protein
MLTSPLNSGRPKKLACDDTQLDLDFRPTTNECVVDAKTVCFAER